MNSSRPCPRCSRPSPAGNRTPPGCSPAPETCASSPVEALNAGRLAGAGLDAFAAEPPWHSPLLSAPEVILSPHAGGSDEAAEVAMATRCVESILAIARGKDPGAGLVLNPEVLKRFRSGISE